MNIDETKLSMDTVKESNELRLDEAVKASKGRITKEYLKNMINKIIEKEKNKNLWEIKLTNWFLNDLEWAYKDMGFEKVFYTKNEIKEHYKQDDVKEYYKKYYQEHKDELNCIYSHYDLINDIRQANIASCMETLLLDIEKEYKRKK